MFKKFTSSEFVDRAAAYLATVLIVSVYALVLASLAGRLTMSGLA